MKSAEPKNRHSYRDGGFYQLTLETGPICQPRIWKVCRFDIWKRGYFEAHKHQPEFIIYNFWQQSKNKFDFNLQFFHFHTLKKFRWNMEFTGACQAGSDAKRYLCLSFRELSFSLSLNTIVSGLLMSCIMFPLQNNQLAVHVNTVLEGRACLPQDLSYIHFWIFLFFKDVAHQIKMGLHFSHEFWLCLFKMLEIPLWDLLTLFLVLSMCWFIFFYVNMRV